MNDIDTILLLLEKHKNVLLMGAGGTGKSYNIHKIVQDYENRNKEVVVTAPTGISAINIDGITINSLLKISDTNSIEEYEVYMNEIIKLRNMKKIEERMLETISKIDLLIIDEVSMISAEKWELIHFLLHKFSFKGDILLSGDIFQLKPVFKESKYLKDSIVDTRLFFESAIWKSYKFIPYMLEKVYRTSDEEFIEILHKIRIGEVEDSESSYLFNMTNRKEIQNKNPTILASTNKFVFNYNKEKLDELTDELCVIEYGVSYQEKSYYYKYKKDITRFIDGYLNIDKKLYLKVGALVMFIVNDKDEGFVNGEKGIIEDIQKDEIRVKKENGSIIMLKRKVFPYYDYTEDGLTKIANIKQFPLKLAFALSIHKCQSVTLDNIIINFENMFASGQFYVALSRAKNPKHIMMIYNKYSRHMFYHELKEAIKVDNKLIEFNEKAKRISKRYL